MFTLIFCLPWIGITLCLLIGLAVNLINHDPILRKRNEEKYQRKH